MTRFPIRRVVGIGLVFVSAVAVGRTEEPREIRTKSRDLEKIQTELNRKREEKERLKKEAESLSDELDKAKAKAQDAANAIQYTRQKTSEVNQQLAVTKNKHDKLAFTAQEEQDRLRSQLGRYQVAALIEGPNGLLPVYARYLIHAQAERVRDVGSKSRDSERVLSSLVETQQIVRAELDRQQEKLADIQSGAKERERELSKKMTRQEKLDSELKELQKNAAELASLIEGLRSKAREDQEKERQARLQKQNSGQSPISPKSLPWPVRGSVLTTFGRHVNATTGAAILSNGIVIATGNSQDVKAVAAGRVIYAGEFMSYGSMVVIEHSGDWYTVYGQLGGWDVEKGQELQAGDKVGSLRRQPNGTGQAYFELRFYGKPTDPLPWLVP